MGQHPVVASQQVLKHTALDCWESVVELVDGVMPELVATQQLLMFAGQQV